MNNKKDVLQIIGSLMKNPNLLSKTDKYKLSLDDFHSNFEKYVFGAIKMLHEKGINSLDAIDIENFLDTNDRAKRIFEQNNGIEYIQDAIELSDEDNFDYYYNHMKKINMVLDLRKKGIDTSDFYCEDFSSMDFSDINEKFEKLSNEDIINTVKKKVLDVERQYLSKGEIESWSIAEEVDDVIDSFGNVDSIGLAINGEIQSLVLNGALPGTLTIRSASSGAGKTRAAVADACKLAYPIYYDVDICKWVRNGSEEKVLFIMTEQTPDQIIKMVLSYLSGINETKFKYNNLDADERDRLNKAVRILNEYSTNFEIMRIPDPNISMVKAAIRDKILTLGIKYVFYDYVFISPNLLDEFRGHNLRNDELLLLFVTALKDIAIEQNVCIFTSTQVNAKADDNREIRNESALAGGRSTINKADNGLIMARPTKEELDIVKDYAGIIPNRVFDIFKVRNGQWTQIRIWSYFDTGILRTKDLFVTDNRLNIIENIFENEMIINWEDGIDYTEFLGELNA